MAFWSITNLLIPELAIIRRVLSKNACPRQHSRQPPPKRQLVSYLKYQHWYQHSCRWGARGRNQTSLPRWSPRLPSSRLPATLATRHAWGAKEWPAASPAKLPGGHGQNSPWLDLAEPGCSVPASLHFLPCTPAGPPALPHVPACSKLIVFEILIKEYLRRKQWEDFKIAFKIFWELECT